MVTLNRAVAVAMVQGPEAGLELLGSLDDDERMAGHHRVAAVRAHLLEMAGDEDGARAAYRDAARRTTSVPERRHLEAPRRPPDRCHRIAVGPAPSGGVREVPCRLRPDPDLLDRCEGEIAGKGRAGLRCP